MTLRSDMADLAAELLQIPDELGFRERPVLLRVTTYAGADPLKQRDGAPTNTDTAITPRPKVVEGGNKFHQYRDAFGGRIEEGDLVVTAVPRTYSEPQLRGKVDADGEPLPEGVDFAWVVDGIQYVLLGLVRKNTTWEACLRRAKA